MTAGRFAGKRIVVLGGDGFIGRHLVARLAAEGAERVTIADNHCTSESWERPGCAWCVGVDDITDSDFLECFPKTRHDYVFNLASPASPVRYARLWLETLRVGSVGTENALRLAERDGAVFIHASTSEVYGNPLMHPQREDYFGNVDSTGPRAVYDEAKRYAEALVSAFGRAGRADARIARIFNTYGPGLQSDDGRVVPALIRQALQGEPMTLFGDGMQTRSFCYVSDLVDGLVRLALSDTSGPVNLGNPEETTVEALARVIHGLVGGKHPLRFVYHAKPEGDPDRRRPDISKARQLLGWEPRTSLHDGMQATIDYFRHLHATGDAQ